MKYNLLCIGKNQPDWVDQAVEEYQKRLKGDYQLSIEALSPTKRANQSEWTALKKRQKSNTLILLDSRGQAVDSKGLANKLEHFQAQASCIDFFIGGPDGFLPEHLEQANWVWSLSPLTFPHGLARVMVVEQLYRAVMIFKNHPYHQGH